MWRVIFLLSLLLGLDLSIHAQNANAELEAVRQLHEQKFRWLSEVDTVALGELLAEDAVYVHSNGWRESKEEVLHNIVSGKLTYKEVQVTSSEVRQYGQTYIVNGKGIFQVALDGNPLTIQLDYTEVYVKSGEQFLLVSRHACRPNP
jgi:hypothetical protein